MFKHILDGRKWLVIAALVAVSIITIPATASASFMSEYKAGNRAEQKLQRKYHGYSVYGFCDQQGGRFWCTVGGSRGDCFVSGHAWVSRSYRVRLVGVTRSCF